MPSGVRYLEVGDGRDGRKRILLQQTLLVQKLSGSAVERRLEETIVQNIRQRLSQRHQNPLLTGPNWQLWVQPQTLLRDRHTHIHRQVCTADAFTVIHSV